MPTLPGQALSDSETSFDQAKGNVIRDVWYGRRSLGEIFWKWSFVTGLIVLVAGVVFQILAENMRSKVPILTYLVLFIPYHAWITVGLWRASMKDGGFWGGVLRFWVVINLM